MEDGQRGSSPEVVSDHGASPTSSQRRWRPSGLGDRDLRKRVESESERVRREREL